MRYCSTNGIAGVLEKLGRDDEAISMMEKAYLDTSKVVLDREAGYLSWLTNFARASIQVPLFSGAWR